MMRTQGPTLWRVYQNSVTMSRELTYLEKNRAVRYMKSMDGSLPPDGCDRLARAYKVEDITSAVVAQMDAVGDSLTGRTSLSLYEHLVSVVIEALEDDCERP